MNGNTYFVFVLNVIPKICTNPEASLCPSGSANANSIIRKYSDSAVLQPKIVIGMIYVEVACCTLGIDNLVYILARYSAKAFTLPIFVDKCTVMGFENLTSKYFL